MKDGGKKLRILVVDDYPKAAGLIARLLQGEGFETVAVESSKAALELCREQPFDLLISDIHMPEMDGWELLREVRRECDMAGIAISGHTCPDAQEKSRAAGFAMHLNKPVELDVLLKSVREVLAFAIND
jgi:two-component system CheB/CheR fusion protein